MDTTRIGIAGDWHGNTAWAVACLQDFAQENITAILQLGDFGIWHDEAGQEYLATLNRILAENGQHLLVTLGNHENYVMVATLVTLTEGEFAGWQVNPEFPHVLYATRGQRWEWEGVSFVSLGGAHSIDRYTRTEGINWWAGEQISYADVMRTAAEGHADIFISHDCPAGVDLFGTHRDNETGPKWTEQALDYAAGSRNDLRAAVDAVKPDILFHGHYHHYLDTVTELVDAYDGTNYNLRTVGLDKDDCSNNLGVLELPSKEFTIIR